MSEQRFTAWLSIEERTRLRELAKEHGCSENFVVRMALRAMLFGTKIPTYLLPTEGQHAASRIRR